MTTTTGLPAPPTARRPDGGRIRRVALLSVHTSPLAQPGVGDGGGLNVYVREVARRLGERGVAVDVFTRRSTPDTPDTVRVADRVRTHHLPAGSGGGGSERLPGRLGRLTDALEGHPSAGSHDLVHAHYWLSGWVAEHVAASWGVPFVQTFHTLGVLKNTSLAPGDTAEPPLRLEVERRLATSADRVLGLTCGEARLLHETFGLSGSSIAVVPAGVDRDVFHPDGPPADPGLLPAGDGPLLLFVGRLQRLKGPDVAVRTLREVRRSLPGARLLIVGGASGDEAARIERPELAKLAAREGVADAVHLLPARPQE